MGWWDTGIMDGDTPCDIMSGIKDFLQTPIDPDDKVGDYRSDDAVEAKHVEGKLLEVEEFLRRTWFRDESYRWISYEVLGFLVLRLGVTLPEALRETIIAAVYVEMTSRRMQGWRNPAERFQVLREFLAELEAYDGTPTELQSTGLFEKMAAHVMGDAQGDA